MRRALLLVSLVALLAGACSGNDDGAASGIDTAGSEPASAAPDPGAQPDTAPDAVETPTVPPAASADTPTDAAAVAVVRAWSTALNAGDNESAAEHFAPGALVIQGLNTLPLPDTAAAVRFNAGLPCSGQIVDVIVSRGVVTAIFELGDRPSSSCDAPPGTLAAADIIVEDGNIVLWQRVPVPDRGPDSSSAT